MPQHSRPRARRCRLRLLGRWQLVADGEVVGLSHDEERLTALLGLIGRSRHRHVAGVLWPESTDAQALANLRRTALQTHRRCPGLLRPTRLDIGLAADVEVDVDRVRSAAAATEHAITEGKARVLLRHLVGEELLSDWYDAWVLPERESLEQLRAEALARIARQAFEAGDLERSVHAARAASDIDPLLESAAELAIRAHLGRGDLESALVEFERYRDAVRNESGASPSRAILELIEPPLTESKLVGIPGRPREPVVPTGRRRVDVRLLGVAALVLAAALALFGVAPPREGGVTGASGDAVASGVTAHSLTRVRPADRAIRTVQMVVRLVDSAAGRAAFLVRTTAQPTLVRLQLSGDAGRSIVRSVLVSSPDGRRLELNGLRPGVYRWLATASLASAVSGQLRIPAPPVTVDTDSTDNTDDTIEAAGPAPTSAPTPTAPPTAPPPAATASAPQHSNDSPQPHPAPRPHPSGQPHDPGTRPVTPVG